MDRRGFLGLLSCLPFVSLLVPRSRKPPLLRLGQRATVGAKYRALFPECHRGPGTISYALFFRPDEWPGYYHPSKLTTARLAYYLIFDNMCATWVLDDGVELLAEPDQRKPWTEERESQMYEALTRQGFFNVL